LQAQKGLVGWVNIFGLVAAQAAYLDGQDWLTQVLAYLEHNRDYLMDYIATELPGIRMAQPEGTYLAWLDCREAGFNEQPDRNAHEFFLNKARVALNDGKDFGSGGAGFVRLNFACPRPILTAALERMKKAWESEIPVYQPQATE